MDSVMGFVAGNLAVIVAIAMAWVGLFAGILVSQPRKDQVAKLQSADVRGALFDVVQENEFFMYTRGFWNLPPQRFIKWGHPILLTSKNFLGQLVKRNLWLAREGVACTQEMEGGEVRDIPVEKYVRTVFAERDKAYDQIPKEIRDKIESSKIGITVKLGDTNVPKGLREITENNLSEENDKRFFANLGAAVAKAVSQNLPLLLGMAGAGAFGATLIFLFTGHLS